MRTTIDIDDALMRKAMRLSGLTTKKAVVEAALRLLIQTYSEASPLRGCLNLSIDFGKSLTHCEFSFHSFSTSRSGTHRTT